MSEGCDAFYVGNQGIYYTLAYVTARDFMLASVIAAVGSCRNGRKSWRSSRND
jgi:hypothetical protein